MGARMSQITDLSTVCSAACSGADKSKNHVTGLCEEWLAVCIRTRAIDRVLIEIGRDLVEIGRDVISTNHITENWSRYNYDHIATNYH